ncbi:MAG: hypothetical protein CVV27_05985 [Candidatus Melainabacteria bacterium HGW-Melainabacteria-1]|nr:MAG: hypothetical protein CVV27_05985 [Candidatus Melainabacteria bacterium HGW-Melainabacteria-1]
MMKSQRGMTIIELVTASSILLTLSLGVATFIPAGFKANEKNRKHMVSGQLFNQVVEEINAMDYEHLNAGGDPSSEPVLSSATDTALVLDSTQSQVSLDKSTAVPTVTGPIVTIGTGAQAASYPKYMRINNVDYRMDLKVVKGHYNQLMASRPFPVRFDPLDDLGAFLNPEALAAGSIEIAVTPGNLIGYKNTTTFAFDMNCRGCPAKNRRVYNWNFGIGEGAGSADAVAQHTFSEVGSKRVFVTVTDSQNPDVAISGEVTVQVKDSLIEMSVSTEQPLAGESLTLTATCPSTAEVDCGTNPTFSWLLGDGSTATGQTITHTYTEEGQYTPSVTVSGGTNPTASKPLTVLSQGGKGAQLVVSPGTIGIASNGEDATVFSFTTKSTGYADSGATAIKYLINFGDGSAPVEVMDDTLGDGVFPTATHSYAVGGSYSVTLEVTPIGLAEDHADNVVSTTSSTVNAKSMIELDADRTNVEVGENITMQADASGVGENPQYLWTFGDGGTVSDYSGMANHSYDEPGVYTVNVKAIGGTDPSTTRQIVVRPVGSTSAASSQTEMKKVFVYVSPWKNGAIQESDVLTTGVYMKGNNR